MPHPFKDSLFVFIGNPTRCTRQAARDALSKVGGVTDERLLTFTKYVVAFKGAENTKVFEKAKYHAECRRAHILICLNIDKPCPKNSDTDFLLKGAGTRHTRLKKKG